MWFKCYNDRIVNLLNATDVAVETDEQSGKFPWCVMCYFGSPKTGVKLARFEKHDEAAEYLAQLYEQLKREYLCENAG